ncbi:hypothetical protein HDU98_007844 [Podochytrium sp. JEL0797]|nr:hypothetical protein HDU98_007844 [Podochytrium sp. JEL0797]
MRRVVLLSVASISVSAAFWEQWMQAANPWMNPPRPVAYAFSGVSTPASIGVPPIQVAPIADWNVCGPSVGTSVCATAGNVCCVTRGRGDASTGVTTCQPISFCDTVSVPNTLPQLASPSVSPETVILYWTATNFTQNLDGVTRFALGINNVPGFDMPINANTGDRIIIYFTNGLDVPTSLHFHGMLQRGTGFSDGPSGVTQCPVAPGQTYVYDFTTNGQVGTFWWHAHYHLHIADGLRGPFIIRDPTEPKNYASEATLQLTDWYHQQSESLLQQYLNGTSNPNGNEPIWDSGLINGIGQFDCSQLVDSSGCQKKDPFVQQIQQGTTMRLRLINTSTFAAFLFSIDGHALTVIEVDGILVAPHVVDQLTINSAQRYSVLITALQRSGNYQIRARMYHGDPWTSAPHLPVGFNPNVVAVLNYIGANPARSPLVPRQYIPVTLNDNDLVPVEVMPTSRIMTRDLVVLFEFKFETRGGDLYQKAYPSVTLLSEGSRRWSQLFSSSFFANGRAPILLEAYNQGPAWQPDPNSNAVPISKGQTIDVIIRNDDPGEHPFHLHGHVFWVLASGVANSLASIPQEYPTTNPLRRDVVTVPPCPHDANGCLAASATNFTGFMPTPPQFQPSPLPETSNTGTWFGYTIVRFVADNPGVWLMHCHIAWHMTNGLAITFVESLEEFGSIEKPAQVDSTCEAFDQFTARTFNVDSAA